jgi:hypothetical protein
MLIHLDNMEDKETVLEKKKAKVRVLPSFLWSGIWYFYKGNAKVTR